MAEKPDHVMVTGASRGLGLAMTQRLLREGYAVSAVSRTCGEALEGLIAEYPEHLQHLTADLADTSALQELVARARAGFGPLYGLVNNAGLGTDGLLSNMHATQIEALITLNVTAPIMLSKFAVRSMMTRGRGRIVNLSSIIASTGFSGLSVYGATKAAMVGFTKSLARELGRLDITVNAIAPGFIDTDMTSVLGEDGRDQVVRRTALRRLAEPQDVAAALAFLLSNDARNVTGTVMTVDAGATA